MKDQKIIKAGNSLAITLPSRLVKSLGLRPGDMVRVEISLDQTKISYSFDTPRQLTLTAPIDVQTHVETK